MNKRASLELSIRAIVIVVLAMTLLGLGLGFIRNMFTDIGGVTKGVTEQIRQQIQDELITGDKEISFPVTEIEIDRGDSEILTLGIRNSGIDVLEYTIKIVAKIGPQPNLERFSNEEQLDHWFQYAPNSYVGDDTERVNPADFVIKTMKVSVPSGGTTSVELGSYLFHFQVLRDTGEVYASKDFFIVVR